MICSKCGHNDSEKPHSLDPWCMYQVKDGVVINAMFLPDRIPEGWYDSPKAAKHAVAMDIIGNPSANIDEIVASWPVVEHKTPEKIDGRTKEGKAAKAKLNDDSSRTN